ncbi:MAG: tetratricopeptide repeat protein [Chloroflexota bacterium]|nr:tetratricopeptide repeat protein [Chloroflexota bacterium]MDE2961565.1 tetratricopeptide repeat protein [Chloroflexota bacterium]
MPKPSRRERKQKGKHKGANRANPMRNAPNQPSRDADRIEAASRVKAGKAKIDAGDYDGAIADYERAIEVDREIATARLNKRSIARAYAGRGDVRTNKGDYSGAVADFDEAIALSPGEAYLYNNRGIAKDAQGDYEGALADFDHSLLLNSNSPYVHNNRGNTKSKQDDYDGAIADYSCAIALNPDYSEVFFNLSTAYCNRSSAKIQRREYSGAITDCDCAIALDPDHVCAYDKRGVAKTWQGDHDGAIVDCDRAIALDPNWANAYNNRGNAKAEKGNYVDAIADYDEAITLNPDDALAYNNRGIIRGEQGDYEGAVVDYGRSIALNPDDGRAYFNRGVAKTALEDYDGAREDYDLALECGVDSFLSPKSLRIFYDVRERVGKTVERQRQQVEVERLQSENNQYLEIADQAINENEQLKILVKDLEHRLREQSLAHSFHPSSSHRQRDLTNDVASSNAWQVSYYSDMRGQTLYIDWLIQLDRTSQRRLRDAIVQMQNGNFGDHKPLHAPDLFERRLVSGLRIYYAKLSPISVLVLGGGNKPGQQSDIDAAAERLADWRSRHPK